VKQIVLDWALDSDAGGVPVTFSPDPSKRYYIDIPEHSLRLAATGQSEDPYTTSDSTTGANVEWQFVAKGNGSWHIQRAAGGSVPRLRSRNNGEADMQSTNSRGTRTYYNFIPGALDNTYFATLAENTSNFQRIQVTASGDVNFVSSSINGLTESLRFTEVNDNENGPVTDEDICSPGTNLSTNGTIVDFSNEQNSTNTISNIIDGTIGTNNRWSAFGFPQYVIIDLGDNYNVNEVILSTFQDRDYQFILEGSTNSADSGFFTLVDATNNTNSGPITESFAAQTVRFVRLTITGANSYRGPWVSISEIEINCAGTTSAKSLASNNQFGITAYPNPFINDLNIISTNTESSQTIGSVQLIDIRGSVIINETVNGNEAYLPNLENLSGGMYLIQILDTKGQIISTKKIIKE